MHSRIVASHSIMKRSVRYFKDLSKWLMNSKVLKSMTRLNKMQIGLFMVLNTSVKILRGTTMCSQFWLLFTFMIFHVVMCKEWTSSLLLLFTIATKRLPSGSWPFSLKTSTYEATTYKDSKGFTLELQLYKITCSIITLIY